MCVERNKRGKQFMTFEEFKRERVQPPAYGTAPVALIAKYQAILVRMEELHKEGAALSPAAMIAAGEQANALANEISKMASKDFARKVL